MTLNTFPCVRLQTAVLGATLGIALSANAQTAPPAEAPTNEVVTMSQFEVTTTQGHGYTTGNSAIAFKTNESLMDIPQADIVVTNDLIRDLGYENTTDVLQYFGVMELIQGDLMTMRGNGVQSQPYLDELATHSFYSDDSVVDSFEVIKGPAQSLYISAGAAGLILKSTKKPLPYDQDIVSASIDEWGLFRGMVDFTGPLGSIGAAKISYRFVGVYQHGDQWFTNGVDNRDVLFQEFQVQYHDLKVRMYYDLEDTKAQTGTGFLTPNGGLFTGDGWKNSDNRPPGYQADWLQASVYGEALQKISDNWEMRISGSYWHQKAYGPYFHPLAINFDTNTETYGEYIENERWIYWTGLVDAQGHYSIGPSNWEMENRDSFGYNFSVWTDKQAYWKTAPFPYPNGPAGGNILVPIYQSQAMLNTLTLPPTSAFTPPTGTTTLGAYNTVTQDALYWQHTMDVVPNWLTLIAGFTWDNIDTESITNWGVLPYIATHTPSTQWVHRLGAVLHLTKNVSLYALNSTNFSSPLGAVLETAQLAPNQVGTGNELGVKWSMLGGRLSGESAWFHLVTTNALNRIAGFLPNGVEYAAVIGNVTLEGIDGDASFTIVPGWQLVGSWYAGHDLDQNNNPISFSYENSLSLFTRYDFQRDSSLKGLSIGGGLTRIGGRWMTTTGDTATSFALPSIVKMDTGSALNGFVTYAFNKHWLFRVNCDNILNQAYPLASQSPFFVDPSMARTFSFATTYKF